MKKKNAISNLILPVMLFSMVNIYAQKEVENRQSHLLGINAGLTFIPVAFESIETDANGLVIPTVGLDYKYQFLPKWSAGFQGAVELDRYRVTDGEIERDNALVLTLLGMYSPIEHLDFFLGGGVEIEAHENLGVFRFGTQYSIETGKHWALVPRVYFDFKEHYNTWSFAVSFARKLPRSFVPSSQ